MIVLSCSCDKKELSVSYKGTQKYEVMTDSFTMRIICHKSIEGRSDIDTTMAYYDKGEYILADGSLFMSTRRDTSYTKTLGKDRYSQRINVMIRPEKYEDNNMRFITLINYFYIYPAGEKETSDSLSVIDKHFAGVLCTIFQKTKTYIYDKDYHLIEIQEMSSFSPE